MRVTFFRNAAAKKAKVEDLTREELAERIAAAHARTKEQLPWLKLALFGDRKSVNGSLRHDANVLKATGAELDYDGEVVPMLEATGKLAAAGVSYLAYTSPSHTPERPRWRVLLPFSADLEPSQRRAMAQAANEVIGGLASPESFKLSQAYYYGGTDASGPPAVRWSDGTEIDLWVGSGEAEDNPFIRAGRMVDQRQVIDADARLQSMRYRAEGEEGIHATQLQVSASLLNSGMGVDEVVSRIVAATRQAAPEGWDWGREERAVRGMCETWSTRLAQEERAQAQVIHLDQRRPEARAEEPPAASRRKGKADIHVRIGKGVLLSLADRSERLMFSAGLAWRYQEGMWQSMQADEEKAWLDREVEAGCEALSVISTTKISSETRAWLRRQPDLFSESPKWDEHNHVLTRSGLLDPHDLELIPAAPEHYATRRIECQYDPDARCPWWEKTLQDCFLGDQETIRVVQEVAGVSLLDRKPKPLMRALVLVGPPDSGKSNVLNVLAKQLSDKPITTALDTLENPHGTTDFIRHAPWLLHEAFDQSKWHPSSVVKALLSGDDIHVNIKNGPMMGHRFRGPVFWGANSPPQFREATAAMRNRLLVVACPARFSGEPVGAAREAHRLGFEHPSELVLAHERPGVLNWALEGLKRALERGRFTATSSMEEQLHDLILRSNLVAGFVEDCVELCPDGMVSTMDFAAAVVNWWLENRGERGGTPSNDSIGRALSSYGDPRIKQGRHLRASHKRYYAGMRLNPIGLEHWMGYAASRLAVDTGARLSTRPEEVNRPIPEEWGEFPDIADLRLRYRAT